MPTSTPTKSARARSYRRADACAVTLDHGGGAAGRSCLAGSEQEADFVRTRVGSPERARMLALQGMQRPLQIDAVESSDTTRFV
eukprot:6191760-Pleurochrysis_carterae.AAC.1